ncbi:MAG: transcription termination factor NusA [Kiritimatiellae bacterium]|nr:transcription termination factor NusA [Kiritimatiellia bacterium]
MATNNDLLAIVNYIERERGVDREIVLGAIESAVTKAAVRNNPDVTRDLRVAIDRKTLMLHVYDTKVVTDEDLGPGYISVARARRIKPDAAEGETLEIEIPAAKLGRIVAAATRQGITDAIHNAERDNTFVEYKNRVGEIVSGTVTAVNHRDLYVMVGKTEMVLPGKERIPMEEHKVGDSIRAIVDKVRDPDDNKERQRGASFSAQSHAVMLSRSSPEFVRTLFRLEVSEIADGVVEIMGIARDAGYHTKIAVRTHDDKVDPVGACVGLKGARVRNIVRELNGEKIDIVRWSDDMKNYVTQALAPAKLESVEVDVARGSVHATVAPSEYSKAIGKRGQNVRLTSKLTGWHVEVTKAMSLASFEDQKAEAIKNLAETFSVSTAVATQLADAGFLTVDGIVESDEEGFIAATGLDEVTAKGLYAAAQAVAELTAQAEEENGEG